MLPRELVAALFLCTTGTVHAATPLACAGHGTGAASGELECEVAAAQAPQRLKFTAKFAGVHDDSMAAMDATLDGTPLACNEGSTPRIQGEAAGDTLLCAFAVQPAPRAQRFKVKLVWYHAQPWSYGLVRE